MRTPAVRVGVGHLRNVQEVFPQKFQDRLVAFEDMLADKLFGCRKQFLTHDRFVVAACFIHRHDDVEVVLQPDAVVVFTMPGGGMDAPRAVVHQNVLAHDDMGASAVERVDGVEVFKAGGIEGLYDFALDDPLLEHGLVELLRDDVTVAAADVCFVRVHGDTGIGRQGPRRCRPDDGCGVALDAETDLRLVAELERDIDGVALFIFVLHFGFGQRGTFRPAPVDRLGALDQEPLFRHVAQGAVDVRFELVVHGQVGVFPVGDDAELFELVALDIDELGGVVTAELADFGRLKLLFFLFAAEFLLDLLFDRQAVAVPARRKTYGLSVEVVVFDDDVFEHLVQCVADVRMAVGIRRPVMQGERLAPLAVALHLFIDTALIPALVPFRFVLGQISAHREIGRRQQ